MKNESLETADRAVAIIGLGAVLPDAPNVPAFWDNILSARSSITNVSPDRWDSELYYDPNPKAVGKTYSKIGGWVRGFEFDGMKFRIPPRVASAIDEAQMWGISVTREALADAGHPDRPLDLARTAAILGNAMGGELHYRTAAAVNTPATIASALEHINAFNDLDTSRRNAIRDELVKYLRDAGPMVTEDSMPGELANVVAGRIAHVFDLHGPNYTVDAACASSLAAFEASIEGLLSHHYDVAVTGGIDRNMGPATFVKFAKIGALSPDGSRPFAKGANGFVMAEGAAVFVIKRLEDAERAGDRIYAVVRGIGASSDGKGKGITAPNPEGQKLAMRRAYERAGIDPSTVGLIEAHGTSTPVGDIAEVGSLNDVLGGLGLPKRSIALGSVKSQIGHLKAAAGAAGMLKAVLALHHKVLTPSANFREPNPEIQFDSGPLYVNTEARPWEASGDHPRRAGVSSFGFGGTNFHIVLEEHIPGMLVSRRAQGQVPGYIGSYGGGGHLAHASASSSSSGQSLLRGLVVAHGRNHDELRQHLAQIARDAEAGRLPSLTLPSSESVQAPERVAIDWGDQEELKTRAGKALDALDVDQPAAWRLAQSQGIFRGQRLNGKVAFLLPGQGSQYVNMLRELRDVSPVVRSVFDEADRVMESQLDGRRLTDLIYVDETDAERKDRAEEALRHTRVTQPAMLAADIALAKLLGEYGVAPDMVMGHSLGEYAALVLAGAMPLADALVAVSARAREMASVSLADPGKMASVLGPYEKIEQILARASGYVVAANLNSRKQTVIAGSTGAVREATVLLQDAGLKVIELPVSHAFHSEIVAPASAPLRKVLEGLSLACPCLPVVGNVDGELYPVGHDWRAQMLDRLGRQIASPVQFIKGLRTLYDLGARIFVEVGPKRVLASFAEDAFEGDQGILAITTNNPRKSGALASFGAALAQLYSVGLGRCDMQAQSSATPEIRSSESIMKSAQFDANSATPGTEPRYNELGKLFAQFLDRGMEIYKGGDARATAPAPAFPAMPLVPARGSVVISGAGIGLPGQKHKLFGDDSFDRILSGEQQIESIPNSERDKMAGKNVVMLVKRHDGSPSLESITNASEVLKLAGRRGQFDLVEEFGIAKERADAFDIATSMAIAAGIEALRDAGIPLVRRYNKTSKGTYLPGRWMLPEPLADETGVIFASAFPGYNRFAAQMTQYFEHKAAAERLAELQALQASLDSAGARQAELAIAVARAKLDALPFEFDRKFLFEILSMGHSQFAELVGARGPNTSVNCACASTTVALGMADDWIRCGRCARVVIIGADDVTSDQMLQWIGAGFLASGAATTEEDISKAALPFDRRRHGMILGMGACGLVVESEDTIRKRGMRGIVEVLEAEFVNSAYHGTRLDVSHISSVMNRVVERAERHWGINRQQIAPSTVFMSHETYTPARGGSAAAEVAGLRETFGAAANDIVIANIKGFTGHPMGVGLEDSIAVKILERQIVPPIPNFKEEDPELGKLRLSAGGKYPVQFALRLAAGFGSQLAISLTRRICGPDERVSDQQRYATWLSDVSGHAAARTEVENRTLRVSDCGAPKNEVKSTQWTLGDVPRTTVEYGKSSAPVQAQSYAPIQPKPQQLVAGPKQGVQEKTPVKPPRADRVADQVVKIFADKTGYPGEMLALDLDLEADLGIDTVKQAEIFAELRTTFGFARNDKLKLRDYPTLQRVIGYVKESMPDLASAQAESDTGKPAPLTEMQADEVTRKVVEIVAAKTGYPSEMLALDLDLEADLGVDTVKQAEVFAEVRAAFDLPRRADLKLRDYPTLGHVIGFVREQRPELAALASRTQIEQDSEAGRLTIRCESTCESDDITRAVLDIVAAKTGYPAEMLALDLDLEADLGVDTVKQAEVFAEVRERFGIARISELKLRDYPTLEHVVRFVREHAAAERAATEIPAAPENDVSDESTGMPGGRRLVPTPIVVAQLEQCRPTGVVIEGARIVIVPDISGTGDALSAMLREQGADVLVADAAEPADLVAMIARWAGDRPVTGVYFLRGLDIEPDVVLIEPDGLREQLNRGVKALYQVCRAQYAALDTPGAFMVAATRMGGTFGYGARACASPLSGTLSGFTKALARERPNGLIKIVDFDCYVPPASVAKTLAQETLRDPSGVEYGYVSGCRHAITLVRQEREPEDAVELGSDSVFVITGAAGGITSRIAADLARHSKGTFYLLDRAVLPSRNNPDIALLKNDLPGLKNELSSRLKAQGQRVTPAAIERELAKIQRDSTTLDAVEAVSQAGATAVYHACDLTDGDSVDLVMAQISARHSKIDVLVHAAGMDRSRPLETKEPAEFDLVFDPKVVGLYNLLRSTREIPVGTIVCFSSVAGRFGNAAQTDYSAANDGLCKLSSWLQAARPDNRALVIDWTAWGKIGMATRGSVPDVLRRAGIELLDPGEGVPVVRREILAGSSGEIVIAGELGVLLEPRGESAPGYDASLLDGSSMGLRVVRSDPYAGVVFEATLDPREPFLNDHRIDGVPVLPGVMGLEIFAQAAATLAPQLRVASVRDVSFESPVKCYRDQPRTVIVSVRLIDDASGFRAFCELSSPRAIAVAGGGGLKRHFSATLLLARAASMRPQGDVTLPQSGGSRVGRADLYKAYFHDKAFQVLEETTIAVGGKALLGRLAQTLPPLFSDTGAAALTAPRLLELCFQTAGVMEIGSTKKMGLPAGIDEILIHEGAAESTADTAEVTAAGAGNTGMRFNAVVRDVTGGVLMEMRGYRTSALPVPMSDDIWTPIGAGTNGLQL